VGELRGQNLPIPGIRRDKPDSRWTAQFGDADTRELDAHATDPVAGFSESYGPGEKPVHVSTI
jgi:hypothetical protein